MQRYPLALFIGRFQPFHRGHLYSLQKALKVADRVLVGVGSSRQSRTESNPWSYEERVKMVREMMNSEQRTMNNVLRGDSSQVKIVGIPDYELDSRWAEEVISLVQAEFTNEDVVVVGNNDWTNDVLAEVGMNVLESGLHNRDEWEGIKIRQMMRDGDQSWRERVPRCVGDVLDLGVLLGS